MDALLELDYLRIREQDNPTFSFHMCPIVVWGKNESKKMLFKLEKINHLNFFFRRGTKDMDNLTAFQVTPQLEILQKEAGLR